MSFSEPGPDAVNCGSETALNCEQCGRGTDLCGGDCTWSTGLWDACLSKVFLRTMNGAVNKTEEKDGNLNITDFNLFK